MKGRGACASWYLLPRPGGPRRQLHLDEAVHRGQVAWPGVEATAARDLPSGWVGQATLASIEVISDVAKHLAMDAAVGGASDWLVRRIDGQVVPGLYALSAHLVVADPRTSNNDQILTAVKHELYDRFGIDHTTIQIESETYAHMGEVH